LLINKIEKDLWKNLWIATGEERERNQNEKTSGKYTSGRKNTYKTCRKEKKRKL